MKKLEKRYPGGSFDVYYPRYLQSSGRSSADIFFLVMLDDTLFYAAIILAAFWTNRQVKKLKEE